MSRKKGKAEGKPAKVRPPANPMLLETSVETNRVKSRTAPARFYDFIPRFSETTEKHDANRILNYTLIDTRTATEILDASVRFQFDCVLVPIPAGKDTSAGYQANTSRTEPKRSQRGGKRSQVPSRALSISYLTRNYLLKSLTLPSRSQKPCYRKPKAICVIWQVLPSQVSRR